MNQTAEALRVTVCSYYQSCHALKCDLIHLVRYFFKEVAKKTDILRSG